MNSSNLINQFYPGQDIPSAYDLNTYCTIDAIARFQVNVYFEKYILPAKLAGKYIAIVSFKKRICRHKLFDDNWDISSRVIDYLIKKGYKAEFFIYDKEESHKPSKELGLADGIIITWYKSH